MDSDEAERAVYTLDNDSISALASFFGPRHTAKILRALADSIEASAIKPEKMN